MTDSLSAIYRILDAAGNRAREGLRVIEDFVRFGRNDASLSQSLKEFRHDVTAILCQLPATSLLAARDTLHDVGTMISTPSEYDRTTSWDVVTASFKRVQEALRTLEEYTKVINPQLSPRLEQLRYRLYTIEKTTIHLTEGPRWRDDHRLYLLATARECRNGFESTIKAALEAGVKIIQSREKELSDREWLSHARSLRKWTRDAGALLIINDRPDLALLAEADGVHVGQDELTVSDARRIVGPDRLIGVSTHSIEQARQAVIDGADYLGVGPTFPSKTKTFAQFPGLEFVRSASAELQLPWFAIGGIGQDNLPQVMAAGATRVAVGSAILHSSNPGEATRALAFSLSECAG
jgi:thiamine-phosphate pyrophosphorylase